MNMIKPNNRQTRQLRAPLRRSRGFSMFELVVYIISVSIIYAYASNRFVAFPADAERANFIAILTQLQSGVSLEFNLGMSRSKSGVEALAGVNPMDLMMRAPSNYLGAFSAADPASMPRRSWYFDLQSRELVYLVENTEQVYLNVNGSLVPASSLRFKLEIAYTNEDPQTGLPVQAITPDAEARTAGRRAIAGALINPVTPYSWGETGIVQLEVAAN